MGRFLNDEPPQPRGRFLDDAPEPSPPAAPPADTRSTGTRVYQDYAAKPLTKGVQFLLKNPTGGPDLDMLDRALTADPNPEPGRFSRFISELLVPQTPLQAGITAGTMGAGPLALAGGGGVARLAAAHPALTRILGGTLGGAAGGAVGDEGAAKGALIGAGSTVAGEGLGALLGRLRLALPGGKGAANRADARRIGEAVEGIVPELGGARSTEGIRAMTEGAGHAALGQAKEGTTRAVEGALAARPSPYQAPGTISVPSLGPAPQPLRAANDELSTIGARAFSKNPLDRTFQGVDQRRLYGDVAREIESGIGAAAGPEAAGAHAATQQAYSGGAKLLDFFKKSGVVDADGFLNVPKMQRMLNNPKHAALLRRHLGDAGFTEFTDAVFRGAPRGETDRMTSGMGGSLDALMQVLRGQNTGFSQTWRVPLSLGLPNVGSKYVGRNPLALSEGARGITDVGTQRGVEALLRQMGLGATSAQPRRPSE